MSSIYRDGAPYRDAAAAADFEQASFHYVNQNSTISIRNQIQIERESGLSETDQTALRQHYQSNIFARKSQHSLKHQEYVAAARDNGRPLTFQEVTVARGAAKAPDSNIAHIISNSIAQTQLNRATAQFLRGQERFEAHRDKFLSSASEARRTRSFEGAARHVLAGLSEQAAAIGRARGLGRAVLAEEQPNEGYGRAIGQGATNEGKRNRMAKDISVAFGNIPDSTPQDRARAYWNFLKNTADSVGNARIADSRGNGAVRSAFDPELTADSVPTPRSVRLYQATEIFGLDELVTGETARIDGTTYDVGYFTIDKQGRMLSSSMEADARSHEESSY